VLALALSASAQTNTPAGPVTTIFTQSQPDTNLTANAIMTRALANRPMRDLSLKARLFLTRDDKLPIEIFVRNTPAETRTIYRGEKTDLLVVQPLQGHAKLYLRGTGQLNPERQQDQLLQSNFSLYDLGFPFMHWPELSAKGDDRVRGRDCYLIEAESGTTNAPYARVKLWIDRTYFGLVRAEAFDADGALVKRFAVTSLKKIGDVWIPRGIEAARIPVGQAMPAEVRSRLEIYDGNYNAKLPSDFFSEDRFSATSR
jgi:hypothetical protein